MRKTIGLAALLLAGFCGQAFAGIIYSETVDGDLTDQSNPLTTLNFSAGANTVSGRGTQGSVIDFDSFAFVIPTGGTLTSATLQMTFSGAMQTADWQFRSGTNVPVSGTFLQSVGSSSGFTAVPQGPDTYQLYANSYGGPPQQDGAVDYVFTFNVDLPRGGDVPEPGSVMLLGGGLAAMAWRLRRR